MGRLERHLDLCRDARRSVEPEDLVGGVVTRDRGNAGVLIGDVEGVAVTSEAVGLFARGEERLGPGTAGSDVPVLDLDADVDRPAELAE